MGYTTMRIKVFICPKCQTGVYSRALKDFRTCTCSAMGVTGGPESPRLSAGSSLAPKIKVVEQNVKASAGSLEGDWLSMADEYGFIPKGDSRLKSPRTLKVDELTKFMGAKEDVKPENREDEDEDSEEGESGEDSGESGGDDS